MKVKLQKFGAIIKCVKFSFTSKLQLVTHEYTTVYITLYIDSKLNLIHKQSQLYKNCLIHNIYQITQHVGFLY